MPKTRLSYEELANQVGDQDEIIIHYDGLERKGHWYEDHMLKMFSECELIRLIQNEYQVVKFPDRMTHCRNNSRIVRDEDPEDEDPEDEETEEGEGT